MENIIYFEVIVTGNKNLNLKTPYSQLTRMNILNNFAPSIDNIFSKLVNIFLGILR